MSKWKIGAFWPKIAPSVKVTRVARCELANEKEHFFSSLIWTCPDGARQLRRGAPRRRAPQFMRSRCRRVVRNGGGGKSRRQDLSFESVNHGTQTLDHQSFFVLAFCFTHHGVDTHALLTPDAEGSARCARRCRRVAVCTVRNQPVRATEQPAASTSIFGALARSTLQSSRIPCSALLTGVLARKVHWWETW